MTPEHFAKGLRLRILNQLREATERSLLAPAGRAPSADLIQQSEGFLALSKQDRELALDIAEGAAEQALFSLLVMLDGSSVAFDEVPPGRFVLEYRDAKQRVTLADSDEFTDLHEWFMSVKED